MALCNCFAHLRMAASRPESRSRLFKTAISSSVKIPNRLPDARKKEMSTSTTPDATLSRAAVTNLRTRQYSLISVQDLAMPFQDIDESPVHIQITEMDVAAFGFVG